MQYFEKRCIMKIIMYIIFCIAVFAAIVTAAPFDTGNREWTQPDGIKFVARCWGDEFISRFETESGYRIIQSANGWYYYATLDKKGEFTETTSRVGIDTPPLGSYRLERSEAKMSEIKSRIKSFNQQIARNSEWFKQKLALNKTSSQMGTATVCTLKLGVILIQFRDSLEHGYYKGGDRPDGYLKEDFENMFFSQNYWIGGAGNIKHPEGEAIFGSMRDLYEQMSRGNFILTGQVVNPMNTTTGVPYWLCSDYDWLVYYYLPVTDFTLAEEAIRKAQEAGYVSENPSDPNYYDKYVVIFAGSMDDNAHGIRVCAPGGINGRYLQILERMGETLIGPNKSFTHVGVYAHEFSHTIGIYDEYAGGTTDDESMTAIYNFDIMDVGCYNGPHRKGECPANLNPYARIQRGWVADSTITTNVKNFVVQYDYQNPKFYKIIPPKAPSIVRDGETIYEHYLIESRGRDGFDQYTPGDPSEIPSQNGRLLIWHHNIVGELFGDTNYIYDRIVLVPADNNWDHTSLLTDFFPCTTSSQTLNDTTKPQAILGYWLYENQRNAHFELKGIHRAGDATIIDSIFVDKAIIPLEVKAGWNIVSVPVLVPDRSVSAVFPTVYGGVVFWYDTTSHNYVPIENIENGQGYWAYFLEDQKIYFAGRIIESLSIHLAAGWNMVGSITQSVSIYDITTVPPDLTLLWSGFQNNNYYPNETVDPGWGYWVYPYPPTSCVMTLEKLFYRKGK